MVSVYVNERLLLFFSFCIKESEQEINGNSWQTSVWLEISRLLNDITKSYLPLPQGTAEPRSRMFRGSTTAPKIQSLSTAGIFTASW